MEAITNGVSYLLYLIMMIVIHICDLDDISNDFEKYFNEKNIIEATNAIDFVNKINSLKNKDTITFTWTSDIHHQTHPGQPYGASEEKLIEMVQISKLVKSEFIVITGDVVNGYYPVEEQKSDLIDVVNILNSSSNIPVFFIEGNHDDNSWYASGGASNRGSPTGIDEVLSNQQFSYYTMNNNMNSIEFDLENKYGGYYYKDFEKYKIRFIYLNCEDIPYIQNNNLTLKYYGQWTMGFRQKQLEWLANKALVFDEEGWGIVIFVHSDSNMSKNNQLMYNLGVVDQLIDDSIRREKGEVKKGIDDFEVNFQYDYTDKYVGEVIAWFSGHIHLDSFEKINGIPHISITDICNKDSGGYDIVTIDRTNRKIYLKRYNEISLSHFNREIDY